MLDKHYDAASVEARIYENWEKSGAFKAGANAKEGEDSYTIVIPPPNVTGSLHMGHALNNTLQDILTRIMRMRGKDVLWQPGMDHAGIATQMVVERQMAEGGENVTRRELGREAFIERVWKWKAESGGTIINQLKRLGASCDWSRERFTMDEGLSKAVLEVFVRLYDEGLIYKDKRLVNWDPKFETAISDLEVENIEVDGHMWHFKYPLEGGATYEYVEKDEDGNVTLRETRDYISIATTRPETMLGDGAVAVHPSDERYASIVGKLCEIPVGPKEHRRLIPIITDDYPDPEFGSGAVKITGAHDFNDYQVARRNDIPMYRLMDGLARMRDDGAPYAEAAAAAQKIIADGGKTDAAFVDGINLVPDQYRGLDRYEARDRVVADINAEGLAVMTTVTVTDEEGNEREEQIPYVESKPIMQPFGDRSKVVIEPMLTDQWFANAEELAKPAIASVREGRTKFVPQNWDKTYFEWMENIQPWCISRQLWWGHQIPAWYGPDGEIFVAKSEAEAQEKADAHYGEAKELMRDPDVLDTWFSSALWPFSTLGWPDETPELARYYQTDVLVTGFDIIFFWVARMMMSGLHFMKDEAGTPIEPFHTVYVHALVRDEKGAKMSKSKGNVINPLDLIDEYGADALRFTLCAMAAQGRDIKLATSRVAGYRNFTTKLWNAARFIEMNECKQDAAFDAANVQQPVNRWLLTELNKAIATVSTEVDTYRFNEAAGAAYRFVWNLFCDWYLELAKPIFNGDDAVAKAETQATAAYARDQILVLLHPFMPFITEELWERTAEEGQLRDGFIMHAVWPQGETISFADETAAADINWLIELVSSIRSVRAEMNVPASAKTNLVLIDGGDDAAKLERHKASIKRLARVEELSVAAEAPSSSAQVLIGKSTVCLPLEGVIDLDVERARLSKELDKTSKEIIGLEKKLSNENFLAKAPQEVVDEQRVRLSENRERVQKLQESLERIS